MLVPCLCCLNSSLNAHSSPPPSPFEHNCSSTPSKSTMLSECNHSCPTPTMSIRARPHVSHPNQVLLNATRHFPPTLCQFAHVPLLPCPLKPDQSSPTPTMSIQAQLLVYHLHCVLSSSIAHLPLPPCQFGRNCSSPTLTMSLQAQVLVSHPDHVYSSSNTSATLSRLGQLRNYLRNVRRFSVLKSGCMDWQKPATRPDRNRSQPNRGCRSWPNFGQSRSGCLAFVRVQGPVCNRSQPVFWRTGCLQT